MLCICFRCIIRSVIGPNGLVPFVLVKHDDELTVPTGHVVNSAARVGAENRGTEMLLYLAETVTRKCC